MRRHAAPWIEQGRQPVLLVNAPMLPPWIGGWFRGHAPARAEITAKTDIETEGYLGTVDGIDVYVGRTSGRDSLLLPEDILVSAGYRTNADGGILAIEPDSADDLGELVFRYSIALEWKPDTIVWLHYPYEDHE
jgi:hypothetical protein